MKKMLFITNAKGGTGKTHIAHLCQLTKTSLRYQLLFGERTPHPLPRSKAKRPSIVKTTAFRRY
jgi:hypothetical protein